MAQLRGNEKVNAVNEDDELRNRGFDIGITLGEGSYAKVKSAFCKKRNTKVAIKIINKKQAPKDIQNKFLPREIEVWKMIKHPNIIQLYEILHFNGKVYMVLEMAGHGDLLEFIKLRGALPEDKAKDMFYQLCSSIGYLHSLNVVHRDLKCENILLDAFNQVKVSDFGFSRIMEGGNLSRTFCGSTAYAAPEILQGIPYIGPSYDIWSMGVILYIMVCGLMPYDESNIKKMIKYQIERKVGFSRSTQLSKNAKNLVHCILESNVQKRYTIDDILKHDWMTSHLAELKKVKQNEEHDTALPGMVTSTPCHSRAPTNPASVQRPILTSPAANQQPPRSN